MRKDLGALKTICPAGMQWTGACLWFSRKKTWCYCTYIVLLCG